jgi:thioredoxin-related protein
MKNLVLLFVLFSISSIASAQAAIEWLTWDEAVERQQQEPRKIFIDVYTDWCGWCKKMDASTFIDPSIANTMNGQYYAVKLDAERKDTIDFNGHKFFNVNPTAKRGVHTLASSLLDNQMSYPSFVILDENFNRQFIIKGYQKVPELLGTLLFFGANNHIRYQQYIEKSRAQQAAATAQ